MSFLSSIYNMAHFLDKLREKPPYYRRAVALVVVTAVVGLIFALWLTALLTKIGKSEIGQEDSLTGTPRPFSTLTEQVRRLYEGGVQVFMNFTELGEPVEYIQEEKLPDNIGGLSN